jgi:soluble lytic murein transglycosylase
MQLMPVTARSLAKQHGIQGYAQKRLLEPELNITLGTHYLVELLRRFDGRLELTLAGYNGGPSRVSRWMRERGSSDIDEFVEEISISETRNFVKAVMNNYAQYVTRSTLSSTRVVE